MNRREFFDAIGAGLGVSVLGGEIYLEDPDGRVTAMREGRVIWFVDQSRVNLDDLVSPYRANKIVRCYGDPRECVAVLPMPKVKT